MPTGDFKPVTADEVSDLALLPRRFDQFVAEFRTSFELLVEKLLPAINRIDDAIADHGQRLSAVEARVARLELAAQVPPPRTRAKRSPTRKR